METRDLDDTGTIGKTLPLYIKEWREARDLKQIDIANAISRDKSVASKIEKGTLGVSSRKLEQIAELLGVTPAALYAPPPPGTRAVRPGEAAQAGNVSIPQKPQPNADGFVPNPVGDRADLPVYASAEGGPTGMILQYDPIEWVKRPTPLAGVSNGFGMYVVGDSMAPVYEPGDMLLIHPNRPPRTGRDVLIVKNNGQDGFAALVKRLVSASSEQVTVRQFNPDDTFTIPRQDIHAIYVIVGKYNSL